ncbi:MAG: trypsin-like peptidase domain-containing protein [Planctomycetes bacterium]|nr:trypsin-like peptidase domain-containing protein [Planctomycetota bacterium]
MSLRHRWSVALGSLCCWAILCTIHAQETTQGPSLFAKEARLKDKNALTRTGARRTAVVAAIERVKGAVVNIHSERLAPGGGTDLFPLPAAPRKPMNGMGTGIIIDPRGYIVTNQHVVDDVTALRIRLADGTSQNAVVVARHPELDLAIIKIEPRAALPVMPIGTASDLMIGETVIAIGNAYGYEHTVSAGVVSAIKRDVSLNDAMAYKSLIQTDASINPGNSGGPLVNINGELVGVNVAIRAGAQGIGFAIPVDHMVQSVAAMLKARRRSSTYDGLVCRDILQKSSDGLVRKVIVDRIDASSPAESAGLNTGDVILQVGTVKVDSGIDVERGLLDCRNGDSVAFVVRRGDKEKRVKLALASGDRQVRPASVSDIVWQKIGLQLSPVGGDLVTRINRQLHGGLEVTNINPGGVAARAGIRKGDILVGLHSWETVNVDNVNYVLNHPDLPTFNPVPFFIVRSGQIRQGKLAMLPN